MKNREDDIPYFFLKIICKNIFLSKKLFTFVTLIE